MALPFAKQSLIMKPLDQPQALRTRHGDDVFPFLVSLQNIDWKSSDLATNSRVFVDLPHILYDIY